MCTTFRAGTKAGSYSVQKIRLLCVMHVVWTSEYVLFIDYVRRISRRVRRFGFADAGIVDRIVHVFVLHSVRVVHVVSCRSGRRAAELRWRLENERRRDSRTRPANSTRIESLDGRRRGRRTHSTLHRTPPLAWIQVPYEPSSVLRGPRTDFSAQLHSQGGSIAFTGRGPRTDFSITPQHRARRVSHTLAQLQVAGTGLGRADHDDA